MKYPMFSNLVRLKRLDENRYYAREYLEEQEYILDASIVYFAKQLDGKTDPYSIEGYTASEADSILRKLDYLGMLRSSRVLMKFIGTIYFTVIIPNVTKRMRVVSLILNRLLLISWLPVLISGIIAYASAGGSGSTDHTQLWIGTALGIIVGIPLHEMGHAMATLGYGGTLYESGLMISCFLPGAYVLIENDGIKDPLRRIQIDAAGVEMNLLIAGVSFFLSVLFPELESVFFGSALNNITLALFNLVFINGLDGAHIIGIILGDEQFVGKSRRLVFSRKERKKMRMRVKGLNSEAAIAVSYILAVMQLVLPLSYVITVLEVINL